MGPTGKVDLVRILLYVMISVEASFDREGLTS